jgi:ssDNA-binding Zn-finger/Zn-ribbon topoisomerase 1
MINESKILELIKRQKETGLNITAFCANEGIPKSSYYYWRKRLNREPVNRFIHLRVNSTPINGPSKCNQEHHDHDTSDNDFPMEISYPNGTTFRIKHALDMAGLRSLVLLVD